MSRETDLELDSDMRLYLIAGASTSTAATTSPRRNPAVMISIPSNTVARPACVAHRTRCWIRDGKTPPVSVYPRIAEGSLVDLETFRARFPKIPGSSRPRRFIGRSDSIRGRAGRARGLPIRCRQRPASPMSRSFLPSMRRATNRPPSPCPRSPRPAAPRRVGTCATKPSVPAGSSPDCRGVVSLRGDEGGTRGQGDPRPSLEELYPDRGAYLDAVAATLIVLREGGYLLDEDVTRLLERASVVDW